jgi:hypothetical protein
MQLWGWRAESYTESPAVPSLAGTVTEEGRCCEGARSNRRSPGRPRRGPSRGLRPDWARPGILTNRLFSHRHLPYGGPVSGHLGRHSCHFALMSEAVSARSAGDDDRLLSAGRRRVDAVLPDTVPDTHALRRLLPHRAATVHPRFVRWRDVPAAMPRARWHVDNDRMPAALQGHRRFDPVLRHTHTVRSSGSNMSAGAHAMRPCQRAVSMSARTGRRLRLPAMSTVDEGVCHGSMSVLRARRNDALRHHAAADAHALLTRWARLHAVLLLSRARGGVRCDPTASAHAMRELMSASSLSSRLERRRGSHLPTTLPAGGGDHDDRLSAPLSDACRLHAVHPRAGSSSSLVLHRAGPARRVWKAAL